MTLSWMGTCGQWPEIPVPGSARLCLVVPSPGLPGLGVDGWNPGRAGGNTQPSTVRPPRPRSYSKEQTAFCAFRKTQPKPWHSGFASWHASARVKGLAQVCACRRGPLQGSRLLSCSWADCWWVLGSGGGGDREWEGLRWLASVDMKG